MTKVDFSELLRRSRSLDDHAIEALLRHVEPRLRGYVESRLGKDLRVRLRDSDVLQNSYIEMLRCLPSFVGETEEQFVAWVQAIIENDIRRQHRWFNAKKRQAGRTSERNLLAQILLDEPTTPSVVFAKREESELLAAAMQQLPEHYRDILELVVIQGLTHEEAAVRMDRSPTASRMLLSRARAALSLEIERLEGGQKD